MVIHKFKPSLYLFDSNAVSTKKQWLLFHFPSLTSKFAESLNMCSLKEFGLDLIWLTDFN